MDASYEDWRHKGEYFCLTIYFVYKPVRVTNVHVTYVRLLFFIEKVMHEEQILFNVNFKTFDVYNDFWKRKTRKNV